MNKKWMLYGANGYTGKLVAAEAKKRGLTPILAGRTEEAIKPLADELGFEYRIFSLTDHRELEEALSDIDIISLCAGPFSATSDPVIKACLVTKTHYVDITGEMDVFVRAHSYQEQAKTAGVVICPGVGFDVIPTDCVAARLKEELPDATHLSLGFDSRSGFSPGTAKTSIEGFKGGNRIRRDGVIKKVSMAYKVREIDFGKGLKKAAVIPWGDVATAFYSTEIPNIEVFMPAFSSMGRLKLLNFLRPVIALPFVQSRMKQKIEKTVPGPTEEQRKKYITYVWGKVKNRNNETRTARITVANGYDVTVYGVLASVEYLDKYTGDGGYYTPSLLMGKDLIESFPGSEKMKITE